MAKKTAKKTTAKRPTRTKKVSAGKSVKKKSVAAAPASKKKSTAKKATTKKTVRKAATGSSAGKKKSSRSRGKAAGSSSAAGEPRSRKPIPRPRPVADFDSDATEVKLPSETQLRKVKTGMSRKKIQAFREVLRRKRGDILGDMEVLEDEARGDKEDHLSPEHMADVGSNNYEQEFTLGLVETERRLLREIDEALGRIERGTYGVCIEKAIPIGRARLEAKPWAKYCIEVVREKERRGEL